jgi:protein arginine kinase activator
MKCYRCPKHATLHITEIIKTVPHELHLCEECAQQYLKNPESQSGEETFKPGGVSGDKPLDELDKLICPTCGMSFREFRNQGRLGCAHCYIAFQDELYPLLENIHGETRHVGKTPKRSGKASKKQTELIRLRNELKQAVTAEQYEQAAKLRDQIQTLEAELQAEAAQAK